MKRGRASTTETPRQLSSLGGKDEEVLFRPRHRKPAGLRKRSWPRRPKNAPHYTPLPGPAVPAPRLPTLRGRCMAPVRGRERTTKCGAHGDDQGRRRTGRAGTRGLEGGRASPGCIPIDDMSPHHHHHTSFPLISPPPLSPFSASSSTKYHAHYWTDYRRPSGGTSSSQVASSSLVSSPQQ